MVRTPLVGSRLCDKLFPVQPQVRHFCSLTPCLLISKMGLTKEGACRLFMRPEQVHVYRGISKGSSPQCQSYTLSECSYHYY